MKAPEIYTTATVASETESLNRIVFAGLLNGYAFAAWQLPGEQKRNVLLASHIHHFTPESQLENLDGGFLFCPFNRNDKGFYLKADLFFQLENGTLSPPENPLESVSHEWLNSQQQPAVPVSFHGPPAIIGIQQPQPDFTDLVNACIEKINEGDFEKIVPSRCKIVPLPAGFDPLEAFRKLCAAYPGAMVSLVSIPGVGTWLGASPEILVQVEDQVFRTVALAGTQPCLPDTNLKDVAWTQKEIEEQALVSRYIINCFKKIRLREFDEHGPKTTVAGNLLHLKTDFAVDLRATNFPQLASVMLNLLHPTSAVCGMPMEPAFKFLQEREGYNRQFYSGFLGPVNIANAIHIFVNLRCMHMVNQHLVCYAGCGVTADSVPKKEWEETEMKLNTLLSVVL
jgi:isochorismate synthase